MPAALTTYKRGDTVLIPMVIIETTDKGNIVVADAGGRQHRVSDDTLLTSGAINLTQQATFSVPSTTSHAAAQKKGPHDPGAPSDHGQFGLRIPD